MSFSNFDLSTDIATVISPLNEVIALSSSIFKTDANIKFYTNIASASAGSDLGGYFETCFDSSPTSSLSTALFDVTYGFHSSSGYNVAATTTSSQTEKIKMYRLMAQALLGDPNSQFSINSANQTECFFLLVKRSIQKDEIRKGASLIVFNSSSTQFSASDDSSPSNFKQDKVGGDYSPLKFQGTGSEVAQMWYNAGVVVIPPQYGWPGNGINWSGSTNLNQAQFSSTIGQLCDGFRNHIEKINFHNQTNLYSTVYFCRALNSEYNYSSNPTFIDNNKRIVVTSGSNILQSRTYITTVGLFNSNDELMGVGKVNRPLVKSNDIESIIRIRLDY